MHNERHVGEGYELTGPRSLTFAEPAGEIETASGREMAYVPVSHPPAHEAWVAAR